ncbi:acyltransferase family protein [Aerosakkonema funiforme]|uniref:acyltransferase family protein n=1 Tax=Aerosakkonema funiforme TaxID=1246630 RepID=UPI0035B92545
MFNKTTKSRDRLQWIDRTKGLAILAILFFHFFQNYPEQINMVSIFNRNGARLGYAAVDIFFVMAGFNTSYVLASLIQDGGKINWTAWLKKRILRLYPTYLLAVLSTICIYIIFNQLHIKNPLNFALSAIGLAGYKFQDINQGFWFFTVILEAYLLTPLIFYVCRNKPNIILGLGILIGLLTKLACLAVGPKSEFYLFLLQNNFIGSYFFQLCLGLYWGFIYASNKSFRRTDINISTIVFIVGLMLYIGMAIKHINIIYMLGFDMAFTPFFFVMLSLILNKDNHNRWLTYGLSILSIMGIYSYQIYLIHQPLFITLLHYLNKRIKMDQYPKLFLALIITGVVLIAYIRAFLWIEKVMIRKIEATAAKQN